MERNGVKEGHIIVKFYIEIMQSFNLSRNFLGNLIQN